MAHRGIPFVGAGPSTAGKIGSVPAPAAGDDESSLLGDGSWAKPVSTIVIPLVDEDVDLATSLDLPRWPVPPSLDGMNVVDVDIQVDTAPVGGTTTTNVSLTRIRSGSPAVVTSTPVSIDVGEDTSYTAATPPVINTSNDDLLQGDKFEFSITQVGGSTSVAKGLWAIVRAMKP